MAPRGRPYASIAELEAAAFNLAAIQQWAAQRFEARMADIMQQAASRIETAFRDAERDRSGNLRVSAMNQVLAANIASDMAKVLDEAGYSKAVEQHLGTYNAIFDQAKEVWDRTGIGFAFDSADVEALQVLADADATYFGRLNILATAAVEKALVQNVMTGVNFQTAARAIRDSLKAEDSEFARHAFTYANDSVLNFSAAMAARRDQEFKPSHYYYAGNLIQTSRQWCIERAGRVWSAKMVLAWEQEDWPGKKPGPILIVRGGWNCKHQWIAVTPAWAKANDLEIETEEPPEVAPPRRKKPPGLEGASYFHGPSTATLQTWQGGLQGIIKPTFVQPLPPKPAPPRRPRTTKPEKEPKAKPAPAKAKDLSPAERVARAEAALAEFAKTESAKEHRTTEAIYKSWKYVRKWSTYGPGARPDTLEALRLHQELFEAKVAHYESLSYDEKVKARNELADRMLRMAPGYKQGARKAQIPTIRANFIDRITRGTSYMPYRLLLDLERNELQVILWDKAKRASFSPEGSKGIVNLDPSDDEDTVAHEFAHAIDHWWTGKGYRFVSADGHWQDGPLQQWVSKKDAKAYRAWFDKQKTGGQGTYMNGDGNYWRGRWIDDYEGRIYKREKTSGTEWWAMNLARYSEWKRTHLDSGDYEGNVGSITRARIRREWEKAKTFYPELTDLIERLFLKPGEF